VAKRTTTLSPVDELKKNFAGPMNPQEIEFLRDIQGLIDFAIRNGLSFSLVLTALSHDVNNLIRYYGMSIEKASADGGFTPMVTGYATADPNSVGETEEDVEGTS
jgi:hypothetical protein